jgi:dTDP-4-dehydrorhamnose reductase
MPLEEGAEPLRKLLVIGASGLLGSRLMSQAPKRFDVIGCCNPAVDGVTSGLLEHLDIGSKEEVERLIGKVRPEVVISAAAMTNVDGCERQPELARRVNFEGPEHIASCCKKVGARLVHVSTDYVFDGEKKGRYTEEDAPNPISVYGSTKLEGEKAVLSILPGSVIARPAVLYGWNPIKSKDNFVTWVLKKLQSNQKATLFEDQYTSPTFADDLAITLLELAERDVTGIWNVSGPDCLDRPACGRIIAKTFGLDESLIVPVLSESVPLPAKRPKRTCLDVTKVEKLLKRKTVSFEEGIKTMKAQEAGHR